MNWGIIFFAWIAIAGIAILISGSRMKASGKITVGWFIGQNVRMERCRDVKGFIDTTYPKIMAFGIIATVSSIALILFEVFKVHPLAEIVLLLVLIVMYIKFTRDITKATEKFLK